MSGPDGTMAVRLLGYEEEARLFLRLRLTTAWQTLRTMLLLARLRLTLVVLLSGLFWLCLFGLFLEGFAFLSALHANVVPLLFNAFFSSLMVMLVFSTGILLYGGLYGSTEARLLLTLPVRAETCFGHKFHEALWFSSWGFVLLGSPMLMAYGLERGASWPYFVLLLPFMLAFIVIPAALGSMLCMGLVAWLPRLRLHVLTLGLLSACAGAAWICWSLVPSGRLDAMSSAWFDRTFARLAITEQRLFPSWWLASGLIEAAGADTGSAVGFGRLLESLKFLALLVANGMLLHLAAGWLARVAYRRGYSELFGESPARRRRPLGWFDRILAGAGPDPGRPWRQLLVKDLRLFRRDLTQWAQFLIFFGLLALYFCNLGSFNYNVGYASLIGFLNLAVVGLILSTFTTRFVYPMISLEGRRFWILGLLPVHRDQIVWSKFLFAALGGLPPCCGLVLLSDRMLNIGGSLLLVHEVCCVVLCLGLSGIAVGLGASMPDLRETSPAKISSGFGGTLSLVLSSLFIVLVVIVAALPAHIGPLADAIGPGGGQTAGLVAWARGPGGVAASLILVVLAGAVATAVPMALGMRAFRRLEP